MVGIAIDFAQAHPEAVEKLELLAPPDACLNLTLKLSVSDSRHCQYPTFEGSGHTDFVFNIFKEIVETSLSGLAPPW